MVYQLFEEMQPFYYKIKMKRRVSDSLMTEFVRRRDKRCVYRVRCSGLASPEELDCSHWQKRRHEGTRHEPDNCDAVCRLCHSYVESDPEGAKWLDGFKLRQLGKMRHDMVLLTANNVQKKDEFMARLKMRELLKTLDVERDTN